MGKNAAKSLILICILISGLTSSFASGSTFANPNIIRWTGSEDQDGTTSHIIDVLNKKLNLSLTENDFLLQEERDLAFNHYKILAQVVNQVPVHGKSIRIWTELNSNKVVQVEASLETPGSILRLMNVLDSAQKSTEDLRDDLSSEKTTSIVRKIIQSKTDDPHLQGIDWKDEWKGTELTRLVKVRGKRGHHFVRINLLTQKATSYQYKEFPQSEISIPVQVYPVYEEVDEDGTLLPRVNAELRYLDTNVPLVNGDIYAPLRNQRYFDFKFNPTLGETEEGRAQGYWSMKYIKQQAAKLRANLPLVKNDWSNGVLLQGRYATINIHPDAIKQFAPTTFQAQFAPTLLPNWVDTTLEGMPVEEMIPSLAYFGKPITSLEEAWSRPARRLPDHNPAQYINDGFDEIQVYYAINTLFETFHSRGFKDPDISTRPFHAFLYNPDIAYRDNAYYTDDTINFTTYSPKAGNAARDNGTVWHELGHGVMDRLMGDHLELADTGGLSEGMADFVAAIVVQAVMKGSTFPGSNSFRIINQTGFNLTNEVHDDGEAYGGAMKNFMDAVILAYGQEGVTKVADVVLEAMRLTRDHPGLTANDWFSHVLFADSLGREGVRQPGELKDFLLKALAGRNFRFDGKEPASFSLINEANQEEVASGGPGSRNSPIPVSLASNATADFKLRAKLKSSDEYTFKYPVQVKVQYRGGPIQGAVHWSNEENGTQVYTLNSENDSVSIPVQAGAKCDEINRTDGSCVDYVYFQIWNHGETQKPVAKKRFYLRVKQTS